MTAIAWNTTSSGSWTVISNTVEKVSPSGWDSYNSGQSGTAVSKAYNIYNEDADHPTVASWIGYTRSSPNYNPGSIPFGIQFPNNDTTCKIIVNGVSKLTPAYDSDTKFEINMENDYAFPTFLMDDVVVYTSTVHADFTTPYYISANITDAGVTLKGDYEEGVPPPPPSGTRLPPPPLIARF